MKMMDYEIQQKVLHSTFDIEVHKNTFFNYLEVVINEDGSIHYAVPSHQEYLIKYLMRYYKESREEVINRCPREYYFDYLNWLCRESKCVLVWNDYHLGVLNEKQYLALRKLKMHGLYKGVVDKRRGT